VAFDAEQPKFKQKDIRYKPMKLGIPFLVAVSLAVSPSFLAGTYSALAAQIIPSVYN
jgi:hypothetical protein